MTEIAIVLVVGALLCALQAMRVKRLLVSALWLAGCSALVSVIFFAIGAHEIAVIELSVGAGLVTVLFVLAISIAGEEVIDIRSIIPKPVAWALVIIPTVLLGVMVIPSIGAAPATTEPSFSEVLWQQRGFDALVQSGLIFAAVVGLLGLLAEAKVPVKEKQPVKSAQPQVNAPAQKPVAVATHEVKA
jgi:NADH:ubiquinone oxidoreductase subunit 6 (subunit J)